MLARLGQGAQLQPIETVKPNLKFQWEATETDRENLNVKIPAAMPAAVSENTPQEVFGQNLANRRCSERRSVGRSRHRGRSERLESSVSAQRNECSPKAAVAWSWNRQVMGKAARPEPPPDGTGRPKRRKDDESRFPREPPPSRPARCDEHHDVCSFGGDSTHGAMVREVLR